jgi:N,N-dimethylformamidase
MLSILGYTEPMSVAPGEDLRVMVSSESGAATYAARLVRLFSGDDNPRGPGFREVELDSPINGDYPARTQHAQAGSYVDLGVTAALDALQSFTLQVLIWPTTPDKGRQAIAGRWSEQLQRGFGLFIAEHGGVELMVGDGEGAVGRVRCGAPLVDREWYLVTATYDADTGVARVCQQAMEPNALRDVSEHAEQILTQRPNCGGLSFLFAACSHCADTEGVTHHFNGKLERPRLASRALDRSAWPALFENPSADGSLVAAWDFSEFQGTNKVHDQTRGGLDGVTVNLPSRAVTSWAWSGEFHDWQDNPDHYAAIHFHDDDLYDAQWECDFVLKIPKTLPSGVYAIRLRDENGEDHVPFFVRPAHGMATAAIAFLAATATYVAYANNHAAYYETQEELQWGTLTELHAPDLYLSGHPELGLSLYDTHADGTPVYYSSRRRPILNMRPLTRLWNFCADLHLLDWLDRENQACDVITDEDLDKESHSLLGQYRVLITGTHPEYWSKPMLEALDLFERGGGRLMYLGGNGFYWRISFTDSPAGAIECRKSEGVRLLDPPAGERCHSVDGEPGGLWRNLGRAPQTLTGVGTTAFGFANCGYFQRCPGSHDPRAAFVFAGIGDDEAIGDFGVTGGAVGFEIDRTDRILGTPSHCLVLATSRGLSRFYVPAPEEAPFLHPSMGGDENGQVRAEMVFYEGPNGGAVFSTGSITWAASLGYNNCDNNVSRITRNVLERFLDETSFV